MCPSCRFALRLGVLDLYRLLDGLVPADTAEANAAR
jgi:hypothetical protein